MSMVAAGKADIGLYYQQDVIQARAEQNVPIKSIGAVVQGPLNIILSLKEKNITSPKDLEGKTIGVQIGTTSHNAAKKVKGAKIVTFNTAGEAILDLSIGGSDAVINDRPVTAYIMTQQPKLGAQLVHQPETYSADDFAFVFRKDQSALKDEVNAALAKLKSNGEYDKIYNKWFGKN